MNDIKLEYMDLDDFLQEGGGRFIRQQPISASSAHIQQERQQYQAAYGQQRQSSDDLPNSNSAHRTGLPRGRNEQNMYSGRGLEIVENYDRSVGMIRWNCMLGVKFMYS